ncbi:hypothetical protein CFOL_v3_29635 [Cephalotus follicularis]|uniref:PHD-type domain-containing protein n=1 Tax=Cephalotus follicularis TaxID=3775 RepID=A0A1Q3D186_CEPFO|nr:hypothetical protein CFOL_v3_29635 [Cephalotus follicularis]
MSSDTARRKERSVEELYNATEMIAVAEITPILRGSCRMQGPVDERDHDIQKHMVSSQSEKRSGKHFMNQRIGMRVESGTCNVCSSPCSSCMHRNLARMGSKTEEFSDETCRVTMASHSSVNEGGVLHPFKSRECDSIQRTTSETSNLHSANSSHDSFSENVESKATMRSSTISDASVDAGMLQKLYSEKTGAVDQPAPKLVHGLDQKTFSNKCESSKSGEGHDDNISCASRANDAIIAYSYCKRNVENKDLSRSSASVQSLGPEGPGKAMFCQRLESPENCSLKDADADSSSPNLRSPHLHSERGKRLIGSSSGVSMKIHSKSEAEHYNDNTDPQNQDFKSSEQDEQDEKSKESIELADMQQPPLQAVSGDEIEESEIVEHDVKVCDICGDAGREDLLAICSRCSDGAEHTYCMKEMLQKVPEGDWLCEECKFAEETESQKQGSDAEERRKKEGSSSTQGSGKRHAENVEVASSAKRQAIETSLGLPNSSCPSRVAVLSRDLSIKNVDRVKARLVHQMPFGNKTSNDVSESARSPNAGPRLQTPKGTLLKANSFNSINSKEKVKLVDEVFHQKLKGTREHASLDLKEGPTRVVGKSMSFKSSNSSESKFKILPSKYSHFQDLKGLKPVKDRIAFERKKLPKLDHSETCSTTASSAVSTHKAEHKLTPRGESNSLSYASNNRESKAVQFDSKSSILSRANTIVSRKRVENPFTSVGTVSANGICNSSEQKLNAIRPKDEPLSSCWTADVPFNNADGALQDGVPWSLESTNQSEKTRESSDTGLKPNMTMSSKGVPCQTCKEIGHAAEHCSVGILQASFTDASAARNSRDEMNKDNKLKAAIEAAMQKRPGIFGKNKVPDQSDGLSVSGIELNTERASQDLSVLNKMKTMVSIEGTYEGQVSCSSGSHKLTVITNLKQLNSHDVDLFRVGDLDSVVPSVGKPTMRDWPGHDFAPAFSVVPEHEYIWQGSFEVHRGGKLPELCSGIQAHLSTCASPKVLEVANLLSHKISLIELPRLSVWPAQFYNSGAKENNIAFYFFAKDIDSYENNYKGLLDRMIKNDLALIGDFDGAEILIFSSDQLPENCQRWNMLFFLWGVCRERRTNCSDSSKNLSFNHPDKMRVSITSDPREKVPSLEQTALGLQGNSEQQENSGDSKYLSRIATDNEHLYPGVRCTTPTPEVVQQSVIMTDLKPPLQATGISSVSNKAVKRRMYWDASITKVDTSLSKNRPVGNQESGVVGIVSEEKMSDQMNSDRDQALLERSFKVEDGLIDTETASNGDLTVKGLNSSQSLRKRPHLDLTNTASQSSVGTIPKLPLNDLNSVFVDGESTSKKLKTEFSRMHGSSTSSDKNSFRAGCTTQTKDLGPISLIEEKICEKTCDEKVIPEDLGTTERYFFPVASYNVNDFQVGGKSLPWKKNLSENRDQFQEGIPNLELALGAETKSPKKGILPFTVGVLDRNSSQDRPPDKKDEDVSASLSLSLSFPFTDKEQTLNPVPKQEQILPERQHVNTPLLLFGDFLNK